MSKRTRLVLDLELDIEPIAGEVTVDGGPSSRFAGYMQLITRLEAARSEALREHHVAEPGPSGEEG